jgi:YfiH family protein
MDVIPADIGLPRIRAFTTLRSNGMSDVPFQSLNFGDHVGDKAAKVKLNRDLLRNALPGGVDPRWLRQIHGVDVVAAHTVPEGCVPTADASWTDLPGMAIAVMTADCLPIVLAGIRGDWVAVVHAGWRGLAAGVIEATLAAVPGGCGEARAWLGPAIGPCCFEVGAEVRQTFIERFGAMAAASFVSTGSPGKYLADLAGLAAIRLQELGIAGLSNSDRCTVCQAEDFFSHRRDGVTGRMATVAMILPK